MRLVAFGTQADRCAAIFKPNTIGSYVIIKDATPKANAHDENSMELHVKAYTSIELAYDDDRDPPIFADLSAVNELPAGRNWQTPDCRISFIPPDVTKNPVPIFATYFTLEDSTGSLLVQVKDDVMCALLNCSASDFLDLQEDEQLARLESLQCSTYTATGFSRQNFQDHSKSVFVLTNLY